MHYDDIDQYVERFYSEPHDVAPAADDAPYEDKSIIFDLIVTALIVAALLLGILFCSGPAHAQTPAPLPPNLPEADPRPAVPYVWGYFGGAWYMTVDGIGWHPDLSGQVCVMRSGTSDARCYRHMEWVLYEIAGDRNWYRTDFICAEGEWYVYYATLGGIYADIRQPNLYLIWCRYMPDVKA